MTILGIDHVQLAMPAGQEEEARAFYAALLGLPETPKPPQLAGRGGAWFTNGAVTIHLGIEQDFRPAAKAHPAFLVDDLAALVELCTQAGCMIKRDVALQGYERVHIFDPFGNRIELMERNEPA